MLYGNTIIAIEAELLSERPALAGLNYFLIEAYYLSASDLKNYMDPSFRDSNWYDTVFMFLLIVLEAEGV